MWDKKLQPALDLCRTETNQLVNDIRNRGTFIMDLFYKSKGGGLYATEFFITKDGSPKIPFVLIGAVLQHWGELKLSITDTVFAERQFIGQGYIPALIPFVATPNCVFKVEAPPENKWALHVVCFLPEWRIVDIIQEVTPI